MNEQLEELARRAIDAIDAGASWMSDELPEYINELLWWKGIESLIGFIFGAVLFAAVGLYWKWYFKTMPTWGKSISDDRAFDYGLGGIVVSGVVCLIGLVFVKQLTWLQILIAPRVFLVEYLSAIAK